MLSIGYEPMIVVTHLDLICRDAIRQGRNWEVEVHHKRDKVINKNTTFPECFQDHLSFFS